MSSGQDPLVGDEGATTEVHVVDVEADLMGPAVGHGLSPTHDTLCRGDQFQDISNWQNCISSMTEGRLLSSQSRIAMSLILYGSLARRRLDSMKPLKRMTTYRRRGELLRWHQPWA